MPFEGIDGRTLTDYRPNCETNRMFMQQLNLRNGNDYRLYLQRNAEKIIQNQRRVAQERNKVACNCKNCYHISNR